MGRLRLLVGAAFVTIAVAAAAEPASGDPTIDKACKKGYVLAFSPATAADTDGNGFVCVDPTTGDIRDDKGQFVDQSGGGAGTDQNQNGLVCYDATTGVIVDDDPSATPPCPPGYELFPVIVFG